MPRTIEQIDADIASFETARRSRLLGQTATRVSYDGESVDYSSVSLEELDRELVRLRLERAAVSGEPSGLRPFRPTLGCRP